MRMCVPVSDTACSVKYTGPINKYLRCSVSSGLDIRTEMICNWSDVSFTTVSSTRLRLGSMKWYSFDYGCGHRYS